MAERHAVQPLDENRAVLGGGLLTSDEDRGWGLRFLRLDTQTPSQHQNQISTRNPEPSTLWAAETLNATLRRVES